MKIIYKITKEEAIEAFKLQKDIPINAIVEIEDNSLGSPISTVNGLLGTMQLNNTATYRKDN